MSIRQGPQGMPSRPKNFAGSVNWMGGTGQRWCSGITTNYTEFAMCAHLKPRATQSVAGASIWSKNAFNATSVNDFPAALDLTTLLVPTFGIDAGGDFVTDYLLTADTALNPTRWNFVGAAYSKTLQTMHIRINGRSKFLTGVNINPGTTTRQWTFGNSAFDNSAGGTDEKRYWGLSWWPRLYNVYKSAAEFAAIERGFDDLIGAVAEMNASVRPLAIIAQGDLPRSAFNGNRGASL